MTGKSSWPQAVAEVVVYGATGALGQAITLLLANENVVVRLVGRGSLSLIDCHEARLAAGQLVTHCVAARDDEAALLAACAGATVVLDVSSAPVGSREDDPLIAAAIASGAHYLDLRGEPAALLRMYERYDHAARKAGVVVSGGLGVDVALGDWLAALAANMLVPNQPSRSTGVGIEPIALDELTIAHAYDELTVTPGGQRSLRALATEPAYRWNDGRWQPITAGGEQRTFDFGPGLGAQRDALTWPGGEVVTVPRHVHAKHVATYRSLTRTPASTGVARVLSRLITPVARAGFGAALEPMLVALPGDATARARTKFAVVANAWLGSRHASARAAGADPAAVTAAIATFATVSLATTTPSLAGVVTPSELWDPRVALADVSCRTGLVVSES